MSCISLMANPVSVTWEIVNCLSLYCRWSVASPPLPLVPGEHKGELTITHSFQIIQFISWMKLNTEQLFSVLVPDLRFRSMDEICCSKVYFPLPHINYYRSGGLHLKVVDTEKVSPLPLLWTIWCCMLFMAFVCSMSWLSSNTG